MVRSTRVLLLAAALFIGLNSARGQEQGPPPPEPVPAPSFQPPPPAPGETLAPNELPPDASACPGAGWFAGLEAGLLRPRVRVEAWSSVDMNLDWTGSPRALLGYRFADGSALQLAYRNLASEATAFFLLPDGTPQSMSMRLDANWLDLDYVSRAYAPWQHWRLQWELGARLASRFLDARGADFSGSVTTSTMFYGAGPHFGLGGEYAFGETGLSLFTRVDGAVTFGTDRQTITFQASGDDFLGPFSFGLHRSEVEADVNFQAGLTWSRIVWGRPTRLTGGVQVEGWAFRGDKQEIWPFKSVGAVGPFLRWEIGF